MGGYSLIYVMRNSKLLTVVAAFALMFANIACACASTDMDSEPTAHHPSAGQDSDENTPCLHEDCEGCDELLYSCAAADSSLGSVDRDARTLSPQKIDLDGPDLSLAFLDTGQTWTALPPHSIEWTGSTALAWVADTPIRRKDQLTE